ncbi:hypothetical protein S83_051418, partial [Arachis hypogaea]
DLHSELKELILEYQGIRRLPEKDMGLEKFALDVHKRFIKQCLVKVLGGMRGMTALVWLGSVVDPDE